MSTTPPLEYRRERRASSLDSSSCQSSSTDPQNRILHLINHYFFSTVAEGYGGGGAMMLSSSELEDSLQFTLGSCPMTASHSQLSSIKKRDCLVAERFAFGFDVDGVLSKGKEAMPEAIEALKVLNGHNEYGIHIPYVVVTNGGGKTEEQKCAELSELLKTEISPSQFVCSHTPMKQLSHKHQTILVVGLDPEKCRNVALSYGFQDVLTTHDFIKSDPSITPFKSLTKEEYVTAMDRSLENIAIEAILVLSSSRDWGADQQIILDLCMSQGGRYGTRSKTFNEGPAVYFAHQDVVWSTNNEFPRIGLGSFKRSLEEIFFSLTAQRLNITVFGKPEKVIFQFAERTLRDYRAERYGLLRAPETIYFVGDSPNSDVRGANAYHDSDVRESAWKSVLVETGIHEPGTVPEYKPFRTVRNVLEAVNMAIAMEQEKLKAGWPKRILSNLKRLSRVSEKGFA